MPPTWSQWVSECCGAAAAAVLYVVSLVLLLSVTIPILVLLLPWAAVIRLLPIHQPCDDGCVECRTRSRHRPRR